MKKATLTILSLLMFLSPLVVSAAPAPVEFIPILDEANIEGMDLDLEPSPFTFDFEGLTFDELMEAISEELLAIFYGFGIEFHSLECFDQLAHLEDEIWEYMDEQDDVLFFEFYYLVLAFTPTGEEVEMTTPSEPGMLPGSTTPSEEPLMVRNIEIAPTNATQTTTLRQTGVVVRNTNFRRGAGTNHEVIRSLSANTNVRITGRRGDWYRVRHDGTTGWVSRNNVVRTRPVAVVTGANVPVRNGRANDARILTRAATGTRLVVTERTDNWARVTVNGHTGWIRINQINIANGSRPGIITANNVNVHTRPDSGSNVRRRLPQDARVMILQRTTSGWAQIRITHGNGTFNGWVRTSSVSNQALTRRTTRQTALRTRPNGEASRIATLGTNQQVTLLARAGSWGHVRVRINNTNRYGWVRMANLNNMTLPAQPLDIGSAARNPTWGVTAGSATLRSGAGSGHSVLRTIPTETVLIIDRRSGEWLRTTFQGTTGWIHHDSIRVGTAAANNTTRRGRVNTATDLRQGAGTNHATIRRLSNGNSVTVLRQSGNWLQIRAGQDEGWVREYHVDTLGSGHTSIRTALRNGPGTSYSANRHISAGHTVTILRQDGGWLRVRFDGQLGWVYARDVNLTTAPGLSTARSQVGTTTRTVNVSGEAGLRIVVPTRRTLAAGDGFDHLEGARVEHVASNGTITQIPITLHQNGWSWNFTHNGTTFTVNMEGILDNLTPGTYDRSVVVRRGNSVVARAAQRIVVR